MITRDEHFELVQEIAIAEKELNKLENLPVFRVTDSVKSRKKKLRKHIETLKKNLKTRTPKLPGF